MDQYSTALGDLIYIESEPEISIKFLKPNLGTFVLGDSCEPKDTMGILQRCGDSRLAIVEKIKSQNPDFSLHEIGLDEISQYNLYTDETTLLSETIRNRDLLRQALLELKKADPDHEKIGHLLSEHHTILRDVLKVSTPKINKIICKRRGLYSNSTLWSPGASWTPIKLGISITVSVSTPSTVARQFG